MCSEHPARAMPVQINHLDACGAVVCVWLEPGHLCSITVAEGDEGLHHAGEVLGVGRDDEQQREDLRVLLGEAPHADRDLVRAACLRLIQPIPGVRDNRAGASSRRPALIVEVDLAQLLAALAEEQHGGVQPDPPPAAAPLVEDPEDVPVVVIHGGGQEHRHARGKFTDAAGRTAPHRIQALPRLRRPAPTLLANGLEDPLVAPGPLEGADDDSLGLEARQPVPRHLRPGGGLHHARPRAVDAAEGAIVRVHCDDNAVDASRHLAKFDRDPLVVASTLASPVVAAVLHSRCLGVIVPNHIIDGPVARI
mmetsp:Transcript_134404/g.374599  ORF Transcript_134404/g.374599 Transcript_134404/m.374599 type:complete len:308 (-) Transcript_134404:642-1565(-)